MFRGCGPIAPAPKQARTNEGLLFRRPFFKKGNDHALGSISLAWRASRMGSRKVYAAQSAELKAAQTG